MHRIRESWAALAIAVILLIAAALRLHGLNWDQGHQFHPDERAIIMTVEHLHMPPFKEWPRFFNPTLAGGQESNFFDPKTSPLNPHFFAYGSFPLYLLRFCAHLLSLLAPLHRFIPWPSLANSVAELRFVPNYDHLFPLGRIISALASLGTIWLVYLLGKRMHSRQVGLMAASFLALTVLDIQVAHFFAVDTILTFLIALTLYFAVRTLQDGGTGNAVLLGLSFGLAIASKFSAAPLLLPILLTYALRARKERALLLTSLLAAALTFALAQPYALLDWQSFFGRIIVEGGMVRGIVDFPYTRQYAGTTPYLYQITQTTLWATSLPLGLIAWGGLFFAIWQATRQPRTPYTLLLAWTVPYFLMTGAFYVKFLRYMLPLFPFLYLMGAQMLLRWRESLGTQRKRLLWYGISGLVILTGLLYSLAFESIYSRPHSRAQASEWIRENLPEGATLTCEHWDDALPLEVNCSEERDTLGTFQVVEMKLYEPDDSNKYEAIKSALKEADYIILSSNRLYGSIPKLPQRYPITTRYYQLLFQGKLGFELLKTFTSYPSILGMALVDDKADESFTVYDHPKVLIFEKKFQLSDERLDRLFADTVAPPSSSQVHPGKSLLLDTPVDQLPVVSDIGWNGLANAHPLLSIITWWLAVEILGLAAMPIALLLFRRLADGGYILSKTLGILVVAYLVWMAASFRLFTNSLPTILGAVLLTMLLSLFVFRRRRAQLVGLLREKRKAILLSEGLFSLAFLVFVGIRILNPDLWQPWNGGEKPMEFAFLNAITKSAYFPPYDPYFAHGYINYYYYGLYIVAMMVKLTGILPRIAYNLAIPLLFALTVANAFSLGYSLTRRYLGGLAGAGLVAIVGNLDGLAQMVERLGEIGPLKAIPGLFNLPFLAGRLLLFDYWRSTRVITCTINGQTIPCTINEFPYFSFLFADLHPHMIGTAFTLLLLALALAIASNKERGEGRAFILDNLGAILALALALGAIATINTWDLPAYTLILLGAILMSIQAQGYRLSLPRAILATVGITAVAMLLYFPFFANYQALYVGLGLVDVRTQLEPFLKIWGLFIFIGLSYLCFETRLFWARYTAWRLLRPPLASPGAWLQRLRALYQEPIYLAIALLLIALGLMVAGEWVLAMLLPMLILAGLLFLQREVPPDRRFLCLLFFMGLGILLGCEIVYIKDFLQGGEYRRMNTIFKFYYQAWVLLGIAGAGGLPSLWQNVVKLRSKTVRYLWISVLTCLIVASSIYTILGTAARVVDRFPGARPSIGTLDGMAFMTVGRYSWPDPEHPIELRYDHEAILWLLDNVKGTPVVAEAAVGYYREGGLRVASYTGLPTLVGAHQNEQRYGWMVADREAQANDLFKATDPERAKEIIAQLRISYIYIGQLEHIVYPPEGLAKFETLRNEGYLDLVYENPQVQIYKVEG